MYCNNSRGERRRGDDETRGRAEPEEQSSNKSSAERRAERRAEAQRRRADTRCKGAEAQSLKPAEFRAEREKGNASRNAGEKRSYIGSARASGARGDCSHAHTKRDAHLASLTPLTGAAHSRNCVKRARAQRRLRSVHSRPRVGRICDKD